MEKEDRNSAARSLLNVRSNHFLYKPYWSAVTPAASGCSDVLQWLFRVLHLSRKRTTSSYPGNKCGDLVLVFKWVSARKCSHRLSMCWALKTGACSSGPPASPELPGLPSTLLAFDKTQLSASLYLFDCATSIKRDGKFHHIWYFWSASWVIQL